MCIIAFLIGLFREESGSIPGRHMNKAHWLSVALDETVDNEKIKFLVDMRYELTKKEEVSNHFLFFYIKFNM